MLFCTGFDKIGDGMTQFHPSLLLAANTIRPLHSQSLKLWCSQMSLCDMKIHPLPASLSIRRHLRHTLKPSPHGRHTEEQLPHERHVGPNPPLIGLKV